MFLALPLVAFGPLTDPHAALESQDARLVLQTQAYIQAENKRRGLDFPRVDADDLRTIVDEFESNGIDPALGLAVAAQESRFQRNAKSRMGARGIFQFMPETARWRRVDPLDVRSSARGAAKYIKDLLTSTRLRSNCAGDIRCALYHYNAGPYRKKGLERPARYVREVLERARKIRAALQTRS